MPYWFRDVLWRGMSGGKRKLPAVAVVGPAAGTVPESHHDVVRSARFDKPGSVDESGDGTDASLCRCDPHFSWQRE
jgi:hypothetical protein